MPACLGTDQKYCRNCSIGQYAAEAGRSSCTLCGSGMRTVEAGTATRDCRCKQGYFRANTDGTGMAPPVFQAYGCASVCENCAGIVQVPNSGAISLEECNRRCYLENANFTLFGIHLGSSCYCMQGKLPGNLSSSACDIPCFRNPLETCGGESSMSVYLGVQTSDTICKACPLVSTGFGMVPGAVCPGGLLRPYGVDTYMSLLGSD